ncbi:MAG: GHMP kinase [Candidatus Aenigmarchaeota archaeon]|nr:GHMP kinase [Candidatus Aenigmarchaeota archaeon]
MKKYEGVFMIVRSRAPVRISFAGGGTDFPYYFNSGKAGCVVCATINQFAWGTLATRRDQTINIESYDFLRKLRFSDLNEIAYNNDLDLIKAVVKNMNKTGRGMDIFLRSDIPPKSGLGSSASAFVALIGLFNHLKGEKRFTNYEIASLAYKLEREELGIGGGYQDQYATTFGGLNFIEFFPTHVCVNPLRIKEDHAKELEKNLVLAHLAERGISGDIVADQTKKYEQKDYSVVEAMDTIRDTAHEMKYALIRGDLEQFGRLLHEGWEQKKRFSPLITTKQINDIYELARKHGAIGGKITGAGGGGHFLFYCEPNKEQIVSEKLQEAGVKVIPFTFDTEGLVTWEIADKSDL